MNRYVLSNRVCDPDYLLGGLLYFFNRIMPSKLLYNIKVKIMLYII